MEKILPRLKKDDYHSYCYAQLILSNKFNLIKEPLTIALEKHLYNLIFSKIISDDAKKIIVIKRSEIDLINKIFIANGYVKVIDKDDFVYANIFYDGFSLQNVKQTIKRNHLGFTSNNPKNFLTNFYQEDLVNLNEVMKERDNIFLHHKYCPLETNDFAYLNDLLYMIYAIDAKRTKPSMKIKEFLDNYQIMEKEDKKQQLIKK